MKVYNFYFDYLFITDTFISKELKIFCPGIRSEKDKQDQKRVMSYADFSKIIDDKCFAVIGRPIIEGDPVQNIKKIIQSAE